MNPTSAQEFDLCSFEELQSKKTLSFQFEHPTLGRNEIALFWDGQNVGALDNYCPHQGAMLSHGLIDPGEIICPLHSAVFDLQTGECLDKYTWDTTSYEVRIVDDRILVHIPNQTLIS
ncbi:MAG: hypothetical protein CL777_03910 [Chloroflexi bacterium]|jgi:nitrite reductase/ring-hydroxylating ferredoxin subunit|nr:hypothetical protein [Chloroflexota bacterium]MBN86157.1 hypothetical protein [Dehalococcoidia bacterium]MCH2531670.1 Rieske (2Fe-2S) protein [Dehalococcoidia bacterium]HCH36020.1 hypothetical protein [Dehalococcoidia bacterium]|tara:strand:- start:3788 stop:4141 length:354 start_codon:yes stop_codon:yes gene_type:complete